MVTKNRLDSPLFRKRMLRLLSYLENDSDPAMMVVFLIDETARDQAKRGIQPPKPMKFSHPRN